MIFFKSVVYKQVAPTKATLNRDTPTTTFRVEYEVILELSRKIPNPPSLSKIPAKIIEPYTGASTWAKGSQRWSP